TYTITDDMGATSSASTNVTITKLPPVAGAGGDIAANTKDDVLFNASGSSSPDGGTISYVWTIEGADYPTMDSTFAYQFKQRGNYTVTLTVIDDEGLTNSTAFSVRVANVPPTAVMDAIPETVNSGDAVGFGATSSFDFDGEVERYAWDFGDGKTDSGKVVTHVYEKPGTYNAILTVWDADNEMNMTSFTVTVKGVAGETYAYVGGILVVCAVVAVIVLLFYFKPYAFGAGFKPFRLPTLRAPRQSAPPPPPPPSLSPPPSPMAQQTQYDAVSYQPQQYQSQSTQSDQYPRPTESSYPAQAYQYGTCPNCGGIMQIPTTGEYSMTIVCPSCGAETTIE
ncbi:MAG: PKD domain-containing protein, partial [Thermoplasmata archaeon]